MAQTGVKREEGERGRGQKSKHDYHNLHEKEGTSACVFWFLSEIMRLILNRQVKHLISSQ